MSVVTDTAFEWLHKITSNAQFFQISGAEKIHILRTRLNLYRMLMIIAVLRRHEAMGTAKGMFEEKVFTTTDEDLRWGLAYIFYTIMQTSAIYNRLRREVKEEVPSRVYISALAFLTLLPKQFTTAAANEIGKGQGIKERAVALHLRSLYQKGYITRLKQGVYCKVARETKKYRHAA